MSRCYGSKISGSQQTMILQIWQKKMKVFDMYDFPVHDWTQEQSGMFLYYFSIPNVMHHLWSFLTMPLIKLWSNNLLTVYYSIPSLRWCTLWQLVIVHISPWFANFIDPNMSLNQIILIRKYFIKHFIAFYFCVAYIICRYLQFLALACFYFQGLKAIYTCFLRITDLFVCLFFHLSLSSLKPIFL